MLNKTNSNPNHKRFLTGEELRQQFPIHTLSTNFNTIGTHGRGHIDEAGFVVVMTKTEAARKMFPGIEKAQVKLRFDTQGKDWEYWAKQGVILCGIGGGPFDEHNQAEFKGECAMSLAAKFVGIFNDPALQLILRYVMYNDRNGDNLIDCRIEDKVLKRRINELMPGQLLKHFFRAFPPENGYSEYEKPIFETFVSAFAAIYKNDQEFFAYKDRYEKECKIVGEVNPGEGKKRFKIMLIKSESELALPYARYREPQVGVFIHRQTTGHFQIHTNKKFGINLADVHAILNRLIQEKKGKGKVITTDFRQLSSPGSVPGAEEIYYNKEMEEIYNGSLSHPDVNPAPLSDQEIIGAIKLGLSNEWFHEDYAKNCFTGLCAGHPCPWYRFGLSRCRTIRYKMREKEEKVKEVAVTK